MGLAVLASRVLGLVREQVFAVFFGASLAMDAYNIAFRIPNLLRDLFAEGAMSASLVPTFVKVRETEGAKRAWLVAQRVFVVLFLGVSFLSFLGIAFAPHLVAVYAPAFREIAGKFELTVSLTRILFLFFPFVVLAAAFMGILNASGYFFWPAFSSALFNAASIVSGLGLMFAAPALGIPPIAGMAWGVVVGGAVQAMSQWPSLRRAGFAWEKTPQTENPWTHDPHLRNMLALMVPGTVGLAATQINILVNSILATSLGQGAVSHLNYAFRLMQFPIGVFGVSLAAATLPEVSRLWSKSEFARVSEVTLQSLKSVFAINLPAAAGLAFLSVPIVELLFQYGRFSEEDTLATAQALAAYSAGLAFYSAVKVLVPICYAMGRVRISVVSSMLSVAVNIALNLLFIKPLGFWGLALGTSATALLNFTFLLGTIRFEMKRRGELSPFLKPLFASISKYLIVGLAMGALCMVANQAWIDLTHRLGWVLFGPLLLVERTSRVGAVIALALLFLFVVGKFIDLSELNDWVRRKKRKSS